MPQNAVIRLRRDTAANWTSADPTLESGELGIETDTRKIKIGDGATAWSLLDYLAASASISDGDKGDITVSGSGATWTIDNGAVSLAKMADMATASVIYRKTAGAGAPEVQTLATLKTDLGLTGTNSGDQTSIVGITGTIAQFNTACTDADFATGGGTATGTNTGDQTSIVGISGTLAEFNTACSDADFVPTGAVTSSGLTMATSRFLGRTTAATGAVEELTAASAKTLLAITASDVSGLAAIATSGSATDLTGTVALANGGTGAALADPGADRLLFWDDSAGAVDWLTLGTNLSITGTTINASGGGGGLSDGDYGDVVVGGTGTTMTVESATPSGGTFTVTGNVANASGALSINGIGGINLQHNGSTKLNTGTSGVFITGKLTGTATSTSAASLNLPHGTAPTSPADGDIWTTTGGMYVRANGVTVGPLAAATGVSDGDKGDITVSGSGATWTIDNDVVTYAKMQNVSATDRLLGRDTAAAGDVEELTVGGGIEFTGSGGVQTSAFTGDVTKAAGGTTLTLASNQKIRTITYVIDGGGSAITTGVKGFLEIPFACTITGWVILADQSGSIVVDVWKDTYANFPPTVADTIAGTEKPTLSSVQKNQDTSLSTWTTSVSAGDILAFNVDSATTVTRVTLSLTVTVT